MKSVIVTRSESGNTYNYFRNRNEFTLSHPLLAHMLELQNRGVNLKEWKNNFRGNEITIKNYGKFKKREIDYYYNKFLILYENNYFKGDNTINDAEGRLYPESIECLLANIRQVTFEVTDRCNMFCAYCGYGSFYNDYDNRENKDLRVDTAIRLLNYLSYYWNSSKNMSHDKNIYIGYYGGEPMKSMSFIREVVDYVKHMNMLHNRFSFSITTNALLLENHMDFLVENDFNLLISLDGDRENNEYRVFKSGKPSYDHIFKSINSLRKKYPEYFKEKVNFNAVFHNKNTVEDLFSYFKETFDKIPAVNELSTTGINPEKREEFLATYSSITRDLSQSKKYETLQHEMFLNLPTVKDMIIFLHQYGGCTFRDYPSLVFPHKKGSRIPTGTCAPFSRKLFVTVNGKILPCERIGHQFSLGYVDDNHVELDAEAISRFYNGHFDVLRPMCKRCYNINACQECLFHMEFKEGKPVCRGFMDDERIAHYFAEYLSQLEAHPYLYERIMKEVISE